MHFHLDGEHFGLRLEAVERVVRLPEITPLPDAPAIARGVLNVAGRIVPVLDLRRRLGLPEREPRPSDQLILARAGERLVALLADAVLGVMALPSGQAVAMDSIQPGVRHLQGALALADGILYLHDLEKFLEEPEERHLNQALERFQEDR